MGPRALCLWTVGCLVFGVLAQPGAAHGQDLTAQQIYQRTVSGTVAIGLPKYIATGCVIDVSRRLVLTSHHVVMDNAEVVVFFPEFKGGQLIKDEKYYLKQAPRLKGKVLYKESRCDLALIQVETVPAHITALSLAATGPVRGDQLHLVGNPSSSKDFWVHNTGKVTQVLQATLKFKDLPPISAKIIESLIPTGYGDSGAPVVNGKGQLVGIHLGSYPKQTTDFPKVHVELDEIRAFLKRAGVGKQMP